MKQPPAYSAWDRISLEIASRAFTYAQYADSAGKADARSGYLKFSHLEALHELRQPPNDKDAWWWNFTPLLKALLAGKESPALLVALGHHTWVGGSTGYRREWLGFLAQDLEAPQNFETLLDICNFTALHTSPSLQFAKEDVLLTSQLLELVNKHGIGGKRLNQSSDWPLLQPLLCRFAGHQESADNQSWPVLVADWRDLANSASTVAKQIEPPQKELYPITPQELKAALADERDSVTPRIPSSFAPSTAADKFYLHYKGILNERLSAIRRMHPVQDLDRMIFGSDNPRNLLPWVTKLPGGLEAYREKMLRTVLWFHDFAGDPLSLGKPRTHFLLSSPLWLPENVQGVATVSMVAYLRDRAFAVAPTAESAAIVNAFRSGSTVVLKNIGEVHGFQSGDARRALITLHDLDWPTGALLNHFHDLPPICKAATCYIEILRRWLKGYFKPGNVAKAVPPVFSSWFEPGPHGKFDKLFELTALAGYYRAESRSGVPCRKLPNGEKAQWSWEDIWNQRSKWIEWNCSLPDSWLNQLTHDGQIQFETQFWLLSFCISAQMHSMFFAFRRAITFSDWTSLPTGFRKAEIRIEADFTRSPRRILISNRGDHLESEMQSVSAAIPGEHTQQVLALLKTPGHPLQADDFSPSTSIEHSDDVWWKAEIIVEEPSSSRK